MCENNNRSRGVGWVVLGGARVKLDKIVCVCGGGACPKMLKTPDSADTFIQSD